MMTENGHNEEEEEEEEALDSVTRKVASRGQGEKMRQELAEVKVQSTNWGERGERKESDRGRHASAALMRWARRR